MRIAAIIFVALFAFSAHAAPSLLEARSEYHPGTILIHTGAHRLDYVLDAAHVIRYPIATPKNGKQWTGYARIDGKYLRPAWSPPADVRHDHPELPDVIPGGAPNNPMGAAAMTLDRDQYAIHGTTQAMRKSVGTDASYGCIRMYNEDVLDLFQRVSVGTLVVKLP